MATIGEWTNEKLGQRVTLDATFENGNSAQVTGTVIEIIHGNSLPVRGEVGFTTSPVTQVKLKVGRRAFVRIELPGDHEV